jgi:hypothetical protein
LPLVEEAHVITIGIDPHKSPVTAVALDASGQQQRTLRLAVTKTTADQLLVWADSWPERRWAVEGATGLGSGVAQHAEREPEAATSWGRRAYRGAMPGPSARSREPLCDREGRSDQRSSAV